MKLDKCIHIICLDAPSPPDYGGSIDMYYKVKSLAKQGVKIILHYFNYKHNRSAKGLEVYCYKIISYKRKVGISSIVLNKPYIVSSRVNKLLIKNLNSDQHPIIFEGFHCTGVIPYLKLEDRKLIIRVHNDEAVYYNSLAWSEPNLLKKAYYLAESKLLEHYQQKLPEFCIYAFLSGIDQELFENKYKLQRTHIIPCFLPWQSIKTLEGIGDYGLYHGNLSVAENTKAVIWLIRNVFSKIDYPFIIAGKNAPQTLYTVASRYSNISIVNSPSNLEMQELVRNAHVHIIPSFNQTGVKLKLLNTLFNGRFCITNKNGVQGSSLEEGCLIAESVDEYIEIINALKQVPFTQKETALRQEFLQLYNNETNARKIIKLLNYADVV